jgi:drug/metabolite transporter (DMT)-like permease
LLTAFIWGTTFVAQRVVVDAVQPMTYNGIRFTLGFLVLIPFALWRQKKGRQRPATGQVTSRVFFRAAFLVGAALFAGATLQQVGLQYTTAAKAGFITGLYVVLVPLLGFFLGQRPGVGGFVGAVLACLGLYLLSMRGGFSIALGDAYELLGAFFWAGHVLLLARFSPHMDSVLLAMGQFGICALLNLLGAAFFEVITMAGLIQAAFPIFYGGVLSVGLAYTLQVVAQKDAPPTHAAIILSLESVFAGVAGWIILGETLPFRGIIGCGLMLAGMLLAQLWPERRAGTR